MQRKITENADAFEQALLDKTEAEQVPIRAEYEIQAELLER